MTELTVDQIPPEAMETLLRRAEKLRAAVVEAEDEDAVLWVAEFPVGDQRHALPLTSLRAAVPLRMVTAIPLAPPHILGILRFQGQIITALSMQSLLGGQGWKADPRMLLVVDPGWGHLYALDCEQTPKPTPLLVSAVAQARARANGPVAEVTTAELTQVRLIDLSRLLERRTGGRPAR